MHNQWLNDETVTDVCYVCDEIRMPRMPDILCKNKIETKNEMKYIFEKLRKWMNERNE